MAAVSFILGADEWPGATAPRRQGGKGIFTIVQALTPVYRPADSLRRMQAAWLAALGFGSDEAAHDMIASGPLWRLRRYRGDGTGPAVLLVPAPIKTHGVWDLSPDASVVRRCLEAGFRVHLLEWRPPRDGDAPCGLKGYADTALSGAVAAVADATDGAKPVVVGHSLGGTLAAIHAGLRADTLSGLVLLSAPVCFAHDASGFSGALSATASPLLSDADVIPGALLTQLSAAASPGAFLWGRVRDAAATAGDPAAARLRMQIERWSYDEVPLSGKLVREVLSRLYHDDSLCRGTLDIDGHRIDPARLRLPMLAAVNTADDVAPPQAVRPFFDAMPGAETRVIAYPGETGIVLQHLGVLLGRKAGSGLWPEIIAWIRAWTD
ncbi:alpha/beta fold hydrolase [Roseovarius salinarum]|uniref:alpha/beta fold hydrolase n=1 Tax=Roseovarius salinarum TaxID=1981892 RepID=UPI0012FFF30D|nr:alpha/beta fold hydrolase [Roseovarius salinarum]